ncbi:MAG: hypothetical protein CHACPFDD_03303 [Phycisphaerae bacterium]|nr:hypothetical protein [Phycisphaerae bacterium]
MITHLRIRNLKRFESADVPLGSPVVFVGPNNAGKTTALQALALWHLGVQTWHAKRGGKSTAKERIGVVVNRRDLVQLPVPTVGMLWRDQHLRQTPSGSSKATQNIRIEIAVDGVANGREWTCAMEFDYQNEEFMHCRPVRQGAEEDQRPEVPAEALAVNVSYLPPMSGLESNERRIDEGAIQVSLGQGKTADVLRNLCYQVWQEHHEKESQGEWGSLVDQMKRLFGVVLEEPEYVAARGEITMSYRELRGEDSPTGKKPLDLSAAGRGFQQTLLLLAFLRWRPKCALLIDEPDAHLEILRQSQTYRELAESASRLGSQLVIATHSEVVLNEAESHSVVAFVGSPHPLRQSKELRKALALLGFDQFIQAEIAGWVLYLEGSTDLTALRSLAKLAVPEALPALERPFHHYVLNQADKARAHFFGLREAFPNLRGIAVYDHTPDVTLQSGSALVEMKWKRRELENYFCSPELLRRWVEQSVKAEDLFGLAELEKRRAAMKEAIRENTAPIALRDPKNDFWVRTKVSDQYLPAVFQSFFGKLGLPVSVNKSDYVALAELVKPDEVDPEVVEVLRRIATVAQGNDA